MIQGRDFHINEPLTSTILMYLNFHYINLCICSMLCGLYLFYMFVVYGSWAILICFESFISNMSPEISLFSSILKEIIVSVLYTTFSYCEALPDFDEQTSH